jgi:hypothetical protein
MVDLVVTAANVVISSNAVKESGTAGVAITAGQVVYKAAATGKYGLADADSATAEVRQPVGIALNNAAANQPLTIQKSGDITIGATLTAGTDYYLSGTPGAIAPRADLAAGDAVVLLGLAKSTTVLGLDIQLSGVTL